MFFSFTTFHYLSLKIKCLPHTSPVPSVGRGPASPGKSPYLWLSWRRPATDGPRAECELWCLWHVLRGIWGDKHAITQRRLGYKLGSIWDKHFQESRVFPFNKVVVESGLERSRALAKFWIRPFVSRKDCHWISEKQLLTIYYFLKLSVLFHVWNGTRPKHAAT